LLSDDKIRYQTCTHIRPSGVLEERTAPSLESIDNLIELYLLRKKVLLVNVSKLFPRIELPGIHYGIQSYSLPTVPRKYLTSC